MYLYLFINRHILCLFEVSKINNNKNLRKYLKSNEFFLHKIIFNSSPHNEDMLCMSTTNTCQTHAHAGELGCQYLLCLIIF